MRELHSTSETIVGRETLGDLEPVYHLFRIVCEFTLPQAVTCGLPLKRTLRGEKNQEMQTRTKPQEELGTRCREKKKQKKKQQPPKEE